MTKDTDNSINHQAFELVSEGADDSNSQNASLNKMEHQEDLSQVQISIAKLEKKIKLIRQKMLNKFYGIIPTVITLSISAFLFFNNLSLAIKGFASRPPTHCSGWD